MLRTCALLLLVATCVVAEEEDAPYGPRPEGDITFFEGFEGADAITGKRFVKSENSKYAGQDVEVAQDFNGIEGDNVVMLKNPAQHYGLVMPFDKPIGGMGADFVLQYEVRLTEGLECGGAYLKVMAEETMPAAAEMEDSTPYIVMFGPDKCGETNKVHFILRHQNPVSKEWEEKHLKAPPTIKSDKYSHMYTLVIQKDNNFKILIDGDVKKEGSLLEEMEPPINPPEMIDDPDDSKPDDWVDEAQISDPDATKPDDWDEDAPLEIPDMDEEKPEGWLDDEPDYIADPDAEKPDDWDDEEDGEFEAPQIENPKCLDAPGCGEWVRPMKANPDYKGKWSAPLIDNPEYKGEWAPKQIANPNFFEDDMPSDLPMMSAVAIEIWTMSKGITFDNVLVGTDPMAAEEFAEATFGKKVDVQKNSAKDKAKAERAKKRLAKKDGTFSGEAQYYFGEMMELAGDYPIVAALVLIAGTFGLLFFIRSVCGSSKTVPEYTPPPPAPAPAAETKREDAEEDEEREEDDEADAGDAEEEDEAEETKETKETTGLRNRGKKKKKSRRAD